MDPELENTQKIWKNCHKTCSTQENQKQVSTESSVDSYISEQIRDMLTAANPNPRMVPEFLAGQPMQPREPLQHQNSNNDESEDPVPPVQETTSRTTPTDPINRLVGVLVGMHNRPSAQTLMVRPASMTTLTFDGKS